MPPAHPVRRECYPREIPQPGGPKSGLTSPYPIDPITMRPKDGSWCQQGARYGAHNTWQWMKADDPLYLTWFNAGVRIVDWSNPFEPKELGYYIPAGTKERFCPQTNEVFVDRQTGLIYITDRWGLGLHILEYTG